jgi:hypothetical protein
MKIQFNQTFTTRAGVEYKDQGATKGMTLGELSVAVLDLTFEDETKEGFKPKLRRAELGDKIAEAEKANQPLELLNADRDMLKERIGKRNFPSHLTAQLVKALDAGVEEQKAE